MRNAFDPALRQRIIEHCVQAVAATPLEREPFPHFCVQGFLPPNLYDNLLKQLPSSDLYEAFDYEKHRQQDGQSNRRRFQMANKCLDQLASPTREFWYSVRSALGSDELKQAVFAKLSPGLAFRFGIPENQVRDLPGHALPELFQETEGYSIKPHPDTRKKVVTMQIALADDDSQRELGTEFYRRSPNPLHWLRAPYGFDIAKRMPFLPNTAYAFSVLNTFTLKSWHGRTAIPGEFGIRNSLLNIWYQKAEHGNADIEAERALLHSTAPRRVAA